MHSETMDEERQMAEARRAFEEDARGRQLKSKWFNAMVILWIVIWAFVGMSGIIPRPLWVVILALLLIAGFAIALFGPRNRQQKPQ